MNKCRSVAIIVEGNEEEQYINRLLSFNIFPFFRLTVINAKGAGNLFGRYQTAYQQGRFDEIFIFCDGDNNSEDFQKLRKRISEEILSSDELTKRCLIFANPVTLQIVLSHFKLISLQSVGKKSNAPIVEKLTKIKNYDASEEQIITMMNLIKYSSYEIMKENLKKISDNPADIPSTNFLSLLEILEKGGNHDDN